MTSRTISNALTFALQGLQRVKREKKVESIFEEIMTENFTTLRKETDVQ